MVKEYIVKKVIPDEEAHKLKGKALDIHDYNLLINDDADVYREDGSILMKYRSDVLPHELCAMAYESFKDYDDPVTNRHTAAIGFSMMPINKDGSKSKTVRVRPDLFPSLEGASTGIIGFFDRYARIPMCRKTAWSVNNAGLWWQLLPFFRAVDAVFKKEMPDRYAAQMAKVKETVPDWIISGTSFSTITVNRNFRTLTHKDAGDLREGFGVMCSVRTGNLIGGYTCFPQYAVAADMQSGGLLLSDVHEWHGNTRFQSDPGTFNRLSFVFYYREKMTECLTPKEELERAQRIVTEGLQRYGKKESSEE